MSKGKFTWQTINLSSDIFSFHYYRGIDVEAQDAQGYTPLMVAILFGQVNASLMLIEKGAHTEGIDCDGRNVVHLAAEQDAIEVLEVHTCTVFSRK